MDRNIRVAISQGDFNGVGIEVTLKALANETMLELMTPLLFVDWRLIEYGCRNLNIEVPRLKRVRYAADALDGFVNVIDLRLADVNIEAGKPTQASGQGAVVSLDAALQSVLDGHADVLVTAPISKEAVQSDSFKYTGHTEYLGDKTSAKPQMILFDENLRVALVTTHLPISEIASAITEQKVIDAINEFDASLKKDFGIHCPKIAVLSLNPHCGDGGVLGNEEKNIIIPAVEECISNGKVMAFGPFASDGFFGSGEYKKYDGVLAMYHDQGLAPFKTLAGAEGVNFTAGLPIVRTSPDHGTAYNIAWQGVADAASMRQAIYGAIDIYRNRQRWQEALANPLPKSAPSHGKPNNKE